MKKKNKPHNKQNADIFIKFAEPIVDNEIKYIDEFDIEYAQGLYDLCAIVWNYYIAKKYNLECLSHLQSIIEGYNDLTEAREKIFFLLGRKEYLFDEYDDCIAYVKCTQEIDKFFVNVLNVPYQDYNEALLAKQTKKANENNGNIENKDITT